MPTRIVGGDESVVDASGREGGTTAAPGVIVGEMGRVARRRQVVDKRSREYILKSGLAGGLAGCAAKTVVAPLDRVKILFQASNPQFAKYTGSSFGAVRAIRDIYSSEGILGLFRGHSATLLRIFPYAAVKFLAYEQIRAAVIPDKRRETAVRRFVAGAGAGCASVLVTYPLEVIRVRLAWEGKRGAGHNGAGRKVGLVEICRRIYNEVPPAATSTNSNSNSKAAAVESTGAGAGANTISAMNATKSSLVPHRLTRLSNFFRGFAPTLVGMLPYAGASFLAHDTAGDVLRHPRLAEYTVVPSSSSSPSTISSKNNNNNNNNMDEAYRPPSLRNWAQLTAGGIAGFVSQTVSYPLEVIRRRMQVGGVVGDGHRLRMAEVARQIWRKGRLKGFFVGLGIGYVKVVPMVATSFWVYGRAKGALGI